MEVAREMLAKFVDRLAGHLEENTCLIALAVESTSYHNIRVARLDATRLNA